MSATLDQRVGRRLWPLLHEAIEAQAPAGRRFLDQQISASGLRMRVEEHPGPLDEDHVQLWLEFSVVTPAGGLLPFARVEGPRVGLHPAPGGGLRYQPDPSLDDDLVEAELTEGLELLELFGDLEVEVRLQVLDLIADLGGVEVLPDDADGITDVDDQS